MFTVKYIFYLWQIDEETVAEFIFGGSKITADGGCGHEVKRHLLLGRKAMNYGGMEQDSVGIADSDQLCFQKQFNKIIIVACDLKQPGQH